MKAKSKNEKSFYQKKKLNKIAGSNPKLMQGK